MRELAGDSALAVTKSRISGAASSTATQARRRPPGDTPAALSYSRRNDTGPLAVPPVKPPYPQRVAGGWPHIRCRLPARCSSAAVPASAKIGAANPQSAEQNSRRAVPGRCQSSSTWANSAGIPGLRNSVAKPLGPASTSPAHAVLDARHSAPISPSARRSTRPAGPTRRAANGARAVPSRPPSSALARPARRARPWPSAARRAAGR